MLLNRMCFILFKPSQHRLKRQFLPCLRARKFSSENLNNVNINKENEENYEENIQNKILEASLTYVQELGWSKAALSSGAEQVGYPGISHSMFPNGGGDLVHYFQKRSSKRLLQYLKELQQESSSRPIPPINFVEKALKARLEMTVPYVSKWPQAIAIMSLPQNVPNSLATLLTMVDDICYYAGDSSVDFNWYARRIAVAGVYKATELYLIQDTSTDFKNSWQFLNKRLSELEQLHMLLVKSDESSRITKDSIAAAFTTARNMIGLN
ncbi:ubiquinone biosynthesis protein COQ9, mitochondrial [Agrilus planipennis]|uniref:Ubiquinone biosynthesis protein n=1 Tax=Agrilus planipennis TaxID=224129 RepID=A0A1W4X965_AGRPL|nr:ubiquinone biosynthesis protein COQ9, mitochondrial [Agrilus planipennis]